MQVPDPPARRYASAHGLRTSPNPRKPHPPVLTLWATVVAERLGNPAETTLTVDRAVCSACVRTRGPRSHPGNIRRLGMRSSQHRPAREDRSMRVRIFVLPSNWTPL
jgi:hypothetical protein